MIRRAIRTIAVWLLVAPASAAWAQTPPAAPGADTRAQYPGFLANSFLGFNAGFIDYPFSARQLEPGFQADAIRINHLAGGIVLYGHELDPHFSIRLDYTRPVKFVSYQNVNHTGTDHTVWMVFADLMLRSRMPVGDRGAVYVDTGIGTTSRHGAQIGQQAVVANAHFTTPMVGAGLEYRVNTRWDLTTGLTFVPRNDGHNQPHMLFSSAGLRYTIRRLPDAQVAEVARAGYAFPAHLLQIGYASNQTELGVNTFVSKTLPLFWGGHVGVAQGFDLHYQQNVFHTAKWFAFDLGASVSRWLTEKRREPFMAWSAYPVLKFFLLRRAAADLYLAYSVAGPTFLTTATLDGTDVGTNRFTFQDFLGATVIAGKSRHAAFGFHVGHYSNGNLFPVNPGVKVPLTFSVGYAF